MIDLAALTMQDYIGLLLFAVILLGIVLLYLRGWVRSARRRRKNEHPQDRNEANDNR